MHLRRLFISNFLNISIFLLASLFHATLYGIGFSKSDSLLGLARSPQQPDTLRLVNYIEVISIFDQGSGVSDSLFHLFNEAVQLASDNELLDYWLEQLQKKGIEERRNYRYNQAVFWHNYQLKLSDSIGNEEHQVIALNNLGLIYRRTNKYQEAIDAYQQAITLSEKNDNLRGYIYATNGLGNIYLELNNLEEALLNFRACLRVEQSQNNLHGVAINLNNIGHVYMLSGEQEKALEYFMLSLEVNREIGSQRGIAICYNDMGDIYRAKGDDEKALNYYQMSLHLNEAIQDLYYLSINNLRIAQIFEKIGVNQEAIKYAKKAIELSEVTSNRTNLAKAYELMYRLKRKLGDVQQAIVFLEKATVLNDSILNENTQRTIFLMQATFNRERADNEIAFLQNEKEIARLQIRRQRSISNLIGAGLFVLVAGLVVLFFALRFKAKANRELKAKNDEIEQASKKLGEYAEKLLQAKQEADRSNQLKSQFLANVSHEIRTPMNSVIGFADLLTKMLTDPKQLGYLESIRSSGRSLLVLIDDILDLSRIEAGKLQLTPKPLDLEVMFTEIKQVFSLQASNQALEIEVVISKNFPKFVLMSESGLRQVLLNIVGNAIKFTSNGEIRMVAEAHNIENEKCNLSIIIEDTGQGIKAEDQQHIFEAFYQATGSRYATKGTGLGLAITKRLVEAMNGTISLKSIYGQGSSFMLTFPEVAIVTIRTALRVVRSNEYSNLSTSGICLLSNDIQVNHFVDVALRDGSLTCDLFESINNFLVSNHRYHKVIWEASIFQSFMAEKTGAVDNQRSDQEHILILKDGQVLDSSLLHNTILCRLPDDLNQLKELLLPNEDCESSDAKTTLAADWSTSVQVDQEFLEIVEQYHQVKQTQLIDEIRHFADQLSEYGLRKSNFYLEEIGKQIKSAAEIIDVVELNDLMNQFDELLNNLTLSKSIQ